MNDHAIQDDDSIEPSVAELAKAEEELAGIRMPAKDRGDYSSINLLIRQADYEVAHSKNQWDKNVLSNVRLVVHFAKKYKSETMSEDDLVQEGILGLMTGVERHDPAKGKLSTYASWWILQKIKRALSDQSRDIRLPVHLPKRRQEIRECAIRLGEKLGRKPSLAEIAKAAKCNLESIADAFEPNGRITFSLDAPVDRVNESYSRIGNLPDKSIPQPDEALIEKESGIERKKLAVMNKLKTLSSVSERDKEIFALFHNLVGTVAIHQTLDSVGQHFGITRERVRQINRVVSIKLHLKMSTAESSVDGVNGNYSILVKRADKTRPIHVRASPAFVNWKPGNSTPDGASAALDFIAKAYELSVTEDLFSTKMRKDIEWARALAATIMLKDIGMGPKEIESRFLGYLGSIKIVVQKIESAIEKDQIVRKDVEDLRSHFRSVMGLQQ